MADPTTSASTVPLALDGWHRAHGARMVPFAGYSMPIQYEGIMAEHEWTRSHAGLFDVSHMGQLTISGEGATAALEALLPADLAALKPGRVRYSLLLAEDGGILDDLMIANAADEGGESFRLVVNGAMKSDDIAHLKAHLPEGVRLTYHRDSALLALQGPEAAAVLDEILPGIADETVFMQAVTRVWQGEELYLCRSGYTGEDGYEISLPAQLAEAFADAVLADERVKPVGLGARDSLRLEAGLPLYGHDITRTTDPVSADLAFALSKRRREAGGFPGAARLADLLGAGTGARRVGLLIEGRAPVREGAAIRNGDEIVGEVTSGGFSPTLRQPIAMGYVDSTLAAPARELTVELRGRQIAAKVVALPFVPHSYRRHGGK